jgi:hypothetical protein
VLSVDVARAIASWTPASAPAEVADFARSAVSAAEPASATRARALLFAAAKLGVFASSVGLEALPAVVLSDSVIERFIVTQRGRLSPATRRTLRSNLRFVARGCSPIPAPAPVPLSRERSKTAYSPAQIDAYLALADAQPTLARRMRLSALVSMGAGAGLMGADLRGVTGPDVVARSGGLVVVVRARRARVVPVLARYHARLVGSARFAGDGYMTGGCSGARRNVTSGLVGALAGGLDLEAIDTGRLRATWLAEVAGAIGLRAFMDAAGIVCSQRLGDLVATIESRPEAEIVGLLGGGR